MSVVFVVFVDQFRKPLILLTFLDFGLVDRLWFLRVVLWFCGSLVVFGTRVAHCVSETGKATRSGINQGGMRVTCAKRTACKMARFAPTIDPKNRKSPMMWFFAVFVVFGRACGSLFQSRDKGQSAKGFDDRGEVVLVTRIGGGYGYDQVLMFQEYPIKKGK